MNLKEYEGLLAANRAKMTTPAYIEFLTKETLERMRINMGLIAETAELRRKLAICEEGRSTI